MRTSNTKGEIPQENFQYDYAVDDIADGDEELTRLLSLGYTLEQVYKIDKNKNY